MQKGNVYQTNKGGCIKSPKNISAGDPKSTKKTGTDLRTGK